MGQSSDYQMALLLQQQFEHEATVDSPKSNLVYSKKKQVYRNPTKSLTDPSWELIDPTPNIHALFIAFNEKYFWTKLLAVCVDWSKRMTSCAGICSYQGRGGLCRITLSEPLLKLRPRKDLVETLLHEMIHAYLFVTHNNRDRDGHGPEFHKHMYRINAEAGTNITVYHDFHDEVRLYKQHWWRCDGPCQNRRPYFGMVRRATNRAPGAYDRWWAEHQQSCGGKFIKVKEPEKPQKKKGQKENKPTSSPNGDIRKFYPVLNDKTSSSVNSVKGNLFGSTNGVSSSVNRVSGFKDLNGNRPKNALANSTSTIVINKKPSTKTQATEQSDKPKPNVVKPKSASVSAFTGSGHVLKQGNPSDGSDYAAVRNHWLSKYSNPPIKRSPDVGNKPESSKRIKSDGGSINGFKDAPVKGAVDLVSLNDEYVSCPVCQKKLPAAEVNAHLDHCLEEQNNQPSESKSSKCPVCDREVNVGDLEKHLEGCLNNVFSDEDEDFKSPTELISCLVCNRQISKDSLNAHLDECMGDNIFSNDSNCVSDELNADADVKSNDGEAKYNCPVCFEQFPISEMSGHLDTCLNNSDEASNGEGVLNSFLEDEF